MNNTKASRYDNLAENVRQREENLNKMSKDDPDRIGLENELAVAKRKLAKTK